MEQGELWVNLEDHTVKTGATVFLVVSRGSPKDEAPIWQGVTSEVEHDAAGHRRHGRETGR